MVAALDTGALGKILFALGVEPAAARIAGARLSVVVGLLGGGLLLLGMSWLARAGRIRRAWTAHELLMRDLARTLGGRLHHGDDLALSAEVHGLRVRVSLEPTGVGTLCVQAHCAPRRPCHIWPKGLEPEGMGEGWVHAAAGQNWVAWVQASGAPPFLEIGPVLGRALTCVFGAGAASCVRHEASGITVEMVHEPGLDPRVRVPLAIDAVVALAGINR